MFENGLIIKTRKLSAREVKKKFHDFIDDLAEGCNPEVEQIAEQLKQHGDDFVDAMTGGNGGNGYNRGRAWHREGDGQSYMRNGMGGGYQRGDMGGGYQRNEGDWKEREELRKKNEQKLREMEQQFQEMRQMMMQGY